MSILLRNLMKAVGVLALAPQAHVAHLRRLFADFPEGPLPTEELLLEFEDARMVLPVGELPEGDGVLIEEIQEQIDRMRRDDPAIWSVDALDSGPQWERLRQLAQEFFVRP